MTTALDKILLAAGSAQVSAEEDTAGELLLAALGSLDEARLLLAKSDDDEDEDEEGGDEEETDEDEITSDPLYKRMVKRGMNEKAAAAMVRNRNKRQAAASAAIDAATIALHGLALPEVRLSWVERTASGGLLALASGGEDDGKKPYGDVTYADPGYQADGKKRYPIDTEAHARAAWNYINKGKNAGAYSSSQLKAIKGRIKSAARKFGIEINDSSESEE